ncbi:hypothetical protein [Salipaludibacillus aurantiacus]|uniref:Uncharacterized protein n=1 Tax=Salipaludibacillus aurantiacus TaxID=1601833 RepID=A0A1H9W028_9BACI|nr:hypothetical protein [Salipaludibacillus aurantiacus]SES26863.1 hypothetical protein SAMN05518684_11379 [Salipaludibacillus aurantiacus]
MRKSLVFGSLISAGGAILATSAYKKRQKGKYREDLDMQNKEKLDEVESADADQAPEERGLTQLDAIHKNDWGNNGFPQTHEGMRELEEEGKKEN